MLKCVLKIIVVLGIGIVIETIAMPPSDGEAAEAKEPSSPRKSGKRSSKSPPVEEVRHRKKGKGKSRAMAPSAPQRSARGRKLYEPFERIMKSDPEPIIPMQGITVQDEEAEGSRRFVKQFKGLEEINSSKWHSDCVEWHEKSLKAIEHMRKALLFHGLPDVLNVALAKITFFTELGEKVETTEFEWPHFFLSGWPSNGNKLKGFPNLSKALSGGKVKGLDESYKDYSLQTITMEFKGKKEPTIHQDRSYSPFFEGLTQIFSSEKSHKEKLIGEDRLKHHLKLAEKNDISTVLYFHSEQSMRQCIFNKIKAKQDQDKKKAKSKVTNHFSTKNPEQKQNIYAIVDIASRYDMCWCCGDTLCSQSHTNGFDIPCYFQVSGGTGYPDRPFGNKLTFREKRAEFQSYNSSIAFTKNPFKPYIAHMANTDFSQETEGVSA